LAQAGKLATLGTLEAVVAHELNNPLTVISAEADQILDGIAIKLSLSSHLPKIWAQQNKIE